MTSIETGPTWLERLNPRNWTLVWKLVIVGLAPALLALTLGALRIADQAGSAAALGQSGRLFAVRSEVAAAGDALRTEAYQASLYVAGGRTGNRGPLQTATAMTDTAVTSMRNDAQSAGLDTAASTALAQATNGLDRLPTLRGQVTGDPAFALAQVRNTYGQLTEGLDVLDRVLLREVRVPQTAGQIDALTAVAAVNSQLATQHMLIGDALREQAFQPNDRNDVASTDVQIFAQYRTYQLSLTPQQLQRYGTFLDAPANDQRQKLAAAVLSAPTGQPFPVSPADWDAAYKGSKSAVDKSATLIRQDVGAESEAAQQQAGNQAGINSVVLMLGLLVGITIAVLVARSLIRSLRVLRSAALDVAERRLPEAVEGMRAGEAPDVVVDPVPIGTRDEVGQVARAFDAVHGQAVRLAADQAALQSNVSAMFVNLSRRSQALVERQLQLIEQLESNEQDADQLSNLFQLDHLATRMRRNSENLLVLAGTDLAKRNIAPVPMVDVLRAAVSEVEQYQRVVVQAPPSASIVGRAGSDLVHLLAELLDNATNFSPPESQVVMSTTRTADGSIVVEIADRGVGMDEHELADANQRLSGPVTVDVSASRRMGLFVVGRLAARHGIGVQLAGAAMSGPAGGLTASVTVPSALVPTAVPAELRRPIGVPLPAGVPAQGGRGGAPARPDVNGVRTDSAAALAAGPATTQERVDSRGPLPAPPSANGSVSGLPTRTPGSSLRGDGPGGPPPGGSWNAFGSASSEDDTPDDRAGDDRTGDDGPPDQAFPSVAEQARRDQEAAALRDRTEEPGAPETADLNGHVRHPIDERSESNDERSGPTVPAPRGDEPAEPATDLPGPQAGGPAPDDGPTTAHGPATTPLPVVGAAEPTVTGRPDATDDEPTVAGQHPGGTHRRANGSAPHAGPGGGTGDELFAPSVPALGGQPLLGDPADDHAGGFDAGETTPIFEEIASAWFRSNRPLPVSWDAEPGGSTPPRTGSDEPADDVRPGPPAAASPAAPPAARTEAAPNGTASNGTPANAAAANGAPSNGAPSNGAPANGAPSHGTGPGAAPVGPSPVPRPVPYRAEAPLDPADGPTERVSARDLAGGAAAAQVPAPAAEVDPAAFASPADAGWQAASGVDADRPDELTAAGLPKRRPRARLVPGSAGSAVLAQPTSIARSAESIRGRLSSYQQGVRQGRESRLRSTDDPTAPPDGEAGEDM